MSEKPPKDDNGSTWHWAYLIPMMALLIPIVAITNVTVGDLVPVLVTLAIIGGTWAAGRNLMGYRHELRMAELEAQRQLAALEAARLAEAQKVLDLDDRIDHLRRTEPAEPVTETPVPPPPATEPPAPA